MSDRTRPLVVGPLVVDPLESRTVLSSVAGLDPGFGTGGVASVVRADNFAAAVYPTIHGGSIVRVSATDLRRLDANGRLVKSFGGGDGVLTPRVASETVAVDPLTGRIALLGVVDGVSSVQFYGSKGAFERAGPSGLEADAVGAPAIRFDDAGRLLVAGPGGVRRILASTGLADPTFGANGTVAVPTQSLPAGAPIDYGYDSPTDVVGLTVRPASAADAGGEVTLVRAYDVEDAADPSTDPGYEHRSTHLDVRRFDADGHALAGDAAVSTFEIGFLGRTIGAYEYFQGVQSLSIAAAADGSLTMLTRRDQIRTSGPPATEGQRTQFAESELLRIVGGAIVARRRLDREFTVRPDDLYTIGASRLAMNADGTRAFVVGHSRVAQFDPRTLKPFTSYNGSTGALHLTSNRYAGGATVDASGRLLLNDAQGVIAVRGPADDVVGAPAGQATALPDGSVAVEGTDGDDVIVIAAKTKKQFQVTVNGHVQTFSRDGTRGIYVRGGDGDDRIDAGRMTAVVTGRFGLFVQPGAGDDTITGSPNADTIEGGDGHDAFDGHDGADLAYGYAADDTLSDADRAESIFARDEDPLFA